MLSKKKSSKVSSHSLAKTTIDFKTKIEFKLEPLIKDPKIEKTLDEIIELFKKVEGSKEKCEYLQEFQKAEKSLSTLTEKLKDEQESISKFETSLKEKILDKRPSLKAADIGDQNFEEDKKRIEEAIQYIQETLEKTKQKLVALSRKAEVALKLHASLQPEIEKFGLLSTFKDCEKETKKLAEKLELVCKTAASISAKPVSLPPASKASIKAFLPGFRASFKKYNELLETTEHHLEPVLRDVAVIVKSELGAEAASGNTIAELGRKTAVAGSEDTGLVKEVVETIRVEANAEAAKGNVIAVAESESANGVRMNLAQLS